jgi:hypothetical protein
MVFKGNNFCGSRCQNDTVEFRLLASALVTAKSIILTSCFKRWSRGKNSFILKRYRTNEKVV